MKRDMELMRKILLAIEKEYEPGQESIDGLKIDGYNRSRIAEHCDLLFQQGLIREYDSDHSRSGGISQFKIGNLTAQGYDYLELIRNNERWEKIKAEISTRNLPNTFEEIARIARELIDEEISRKP
jgi:hypothetical protein